METYLSSCDVSSAVLNRQGDLNCWRRKSLGSRAYSGATAAAKLQKCCHHSSVRVTYSAITYQWLQMDLPFAPKEMSETSETLGAFTIEPSLVSMVVERSIGIT
eukprot:6320678-Amphidinium_carterae.1